jgi:hypothetical protein
MKEHMCVVGRKARVLFLLCDPCHKRFTFREVNLQARHVLEAKKDEFKVCNSQMLGFYHDHGAIRMLEVCDSFRDEMGYHAMYVPCLISMP